MKQRVVEFNSGSSTPFNLEAFHAYDETWRLRLFPDGRPCLFATLKEAMAYAKEHAADENIIIHPVE